MVSAPADSDGPSEPTRRVEASPPAPDPAEVPIIELMPLVEQASSADEAPAEGAPESLTHQPIPANPLHLCPACDYILTGLTSRRCPECGTPFTEWEARVRASDLSPEVTSIIRGIRLRRVVVVFALVLMAVSAVLPGLVHRVSKPPTFWIGVPPPPIRGPTVYDVIPPMVQIVLLNYAAIMRYWLDIPWWKTLLVASLFGVILALMFCSM